MSWKSRRNKRLIEESRRQTRLAIQAEHERRIEENAEMAREGYIVQGYDSSGNRVRRTQPVSAFENHWHTLPARIFLGVLRYFRGLS